MRGVYVGSIRIATGFGGEPNHVSAVPKHRDATLLALNSKWGNDPRLGEQKVEGWRDVTEEGGP